MPKPLTINHKLLTGLRVALVHDDFVQEARGGEEVFLAIAELFPEAPIYTSMATGEWVKRIASSQQSGASSRKISTSFMQKIPFKRKLQRALFPLYPLAFESFDFSDYDLVISSSSRFAHGVITKPETKHICYMNNPGRMFWESSQYFGSTPKTGDMQMDANEKARMNANKGSSKLKTILSPALSYLRLWSYAAAQRVDHFIANSQNIAGKIERYFNREATVIYPFVDLQRFTPQVVNGELSMVNGIGKKKQLTINHKPLTGGYYLVVTRLNRWKRVDLAITAARNLGLRLKIVGEGPERKRLEKLAISHKPLASSQIEFMGKVSVEKLALLYRNCAALIMTQEEDFGLTALEAQACGRPVVAYGAGGVLETVVNPEKARTLSGQGATGEFFYPQTTDALVSVLRRFKPEAYDPVQCRKNAERFSRAMFEEDFLKEIERAVSS